MKYEFYDTNLGSIFGLTDDIKKDEKSFRINSSTISFLWNRNNTSLEITIDNADILLLPNQIVTTTYLHHVSFEKTQLPLTSFLFNREFYCIADHDSEVSCNGILFFGTQDLPIITIPEAQEKKFETLYEIFQDEFATPDKIQGDMLQMLLKRLIIICTRLAKEQLILKDFDNDQVDVIRKFNVLVDTHYKTKRKVAEYADLLFKSPKTLSNLFAKYNQKSPQQIILERITLEAKRLMQFTDKQNQEIAFELGFNDSAHFSSFFKKMTSTSPTQYRENKSILS
ncbi:helix-turn-helix domain-containing protein [Cellulophaga sp. E16_2]|uniref:Transcriptional regulator, AraC family n=1 Tax=Cellulophaga algicola (strain DSM 14237 / IC166 / ACAM 630) TaxID=688270 RepID=E6X7Z2_CELAD|nr:MULTISPECIES: helix-turn-helix domain-containing protein [Cellulophaga]ADV48590.1 transcriptional regulator, AraC family [Cellulophaga algicola DSM 14237]MBO0591008.1 helix-turn-helix domain-containing protein [Cellulophaga sp. E16_2]